MFPLDRLTQAMYAAVALAIVLASTAEAQLSIDFENPPYVTGSIQTQEGWTGGANFPRVQTESQIAAELTAAGLNPGATVHGGSQSLLVTYNPEESEGGLVRKFFSGLESEPHVAMDWWARPLNPGSEGSTIGFELGNTFVGIQDASNRRAASVRFGVTRDDMDVITGTTIDFGSASSPAVWIPSGESWNGDNWYNFRFELDYATKQYDFFIDDTKVNESPIQFYSTASSSAAALFISRGQNNAGQILDDFDIGVDFSKKLLLSINPEDGNAVVENITDAAITFDSYTIASTSNSLLADWSSFADQSVAGWEEAAPSVGRVSELNPTGAVTIDPGQSIALAGLWNTAGVQDVSDLSFQYRDSILGTQNGGVEFTSTADGDYDGNNVVDGRDFLVWQRGGSPDPLSAGDLSAWKDSFGSGTTAQVAAASVPEPGAALLMALGLGLVPLNRRTR